MNEYSKSFLTAVLIIFGVTFLLAIIASILVTKSIVRPINYLRQKISSISLAELYKRVDYSNKDEIKELADSFNNMLGRLESAYKEIDESKSHLEIKVKERTQELEQEIAKKNEYEKQLQKAFNKINKIKEELKVSLEKEKDLNSLKSNFVRTVSQEYRTPLTIILTSSYLLEKFFINKDEISFQKQIGKIKDSIEKMRNLIDDTFALSSIDMESSTENNKDIDLVYILKDILDQFQNDHKDFQFEFETNVKNIAMKSDPTKIQKCMAQLLSNAIKFTKDNKKVLVKVSKTDEGIKVFVKDYGIGIPSDDKDKIFSPFYRSHNINGTPGTGLGLALTKELIENIGGKISVESKETEGTTFQIVFDAKLVSKDQAVMS